VQCRSRFREAASTTLLQRLLSRSIQAEIADQLAELRNAGVQTLRGEPSSLAPGWIRVDRGPGQPDAVLRADCTVVCVGVRRTLLSLALVKFGVHGPQHLLQMPVLPESVIVAGGDDFGTALAAFSSAVGIHTELLTRSVDNSSLLELALETGVKIVEQPDTRLLADAVFRPSGNVSESLTPILDCAALSALPDTCDWTPSVYKLMRTGFSGARRRWNRGAQGSLGQGEVVGFSPENFSDATQQAARILEVACRKRVPATHFQTRRQLTATS
jgi:hypothetical protein